MEPNVYLIGPRASGKTSLGLALARRLCRGFADTDALFFEKWGQSIGAFVSSQGWEAFRDEETRILEAVNCTSGRVIACGGGVVLRPLNREFLSRGRVLYLRGDPSLLACRLVVDRNEAQRPPLTNYTFNEEVVKVLTERASLYNSVADVLLDAALFPDDLLQQAIAAINF